MRTRIVVLLAALSGQAGLVRAQSSGLEGTLDAICRAAIERQGVGFSVAVAREGRTVFARGYGRSSIRGDVPVDTDTRFAIGSVTKQFTCACVLLLAEDGKLSVRDPVAKYYPEVTRAGDITLLDLMNHVSGIPDYYPLDFVDTRMRQAIEPDELIRRYGGARLDFAPRTRWSYSNTGYILLGRIVEKVSRQPFGQFLDARILQPLGLAHTLYEPGDDAKGLAQGYVTFALGDPEPCTPEAKGWIGAAGAIWSTAADLATWDLALMGGKVLSTVSLELMTSSGVCVGGRRTGYGCGLSIGLRDGRAVWSHNGAVDGFLASNTMVPSLGVAVVVLSNLGVGAAAGDLADRLLAQVVADPVPAVPVVHGPAIAEVVRAVFTELQAGKLDRSRFTPDFDAWLDDGRASGAHTRLAGFGDPEHVTVLRASERGGMEVSTTRLTFAHGALRVLMYRQVDGKIAQFFVLAD